MVTPSLGQGPYGTGACGKKGVYWHPRENSSTSPWLSLDSRNLPGLGDVRTADFPGKSLG